MKRDASLVDAGARLVASSDWPAPVMHPLAAIQNGITRRPLDGSAPSWPPEQGVSLHRMMRSSCTGAGWAWRLERKRGRHNPGENAAR